MTVLSSVLVLIALCFFTWVVFTPYSGPPPSITEGLKEYVEEEGAIQHHKNLGRRLQGDALDVG